MVDYNNTSYRLKMTCGACPEQYDVYDKEDNLIAYLRLRHGYFYAACPHVGGVVVYEASPRGDGVFESYEREHYLSTALEAIKKYYEKPYECYH